MSWGAVAGAAVGAVGSQLGKKDKGGGAGTTTQSKDPWDKSQPWLEALLDRGANMSQVYEANPFNAQQKQAFSNGYGLSDYARTLVPSLLGQMQQQPLGYDPKNPTAKAKAYDWGGNDLISMLTGGSMSQANTDQAAKDKAAQAARDAEWLRRNAAAKPAAATAQPAGMEPALYDGRAETGRWF